MYNVLRGNFLRERIPTLTNIYLCAKAGSGKTFACNYLREHYGYKQAKMAYPVYAIAQNYFQMQGKDRRLLQVIGTDVGRVQVNQDIWVNRFVEDIRIVQGTEELLKKEPRSYFVSDDVRFLNEHVALKQAGWVGIFLDVPDAIRIERLIRRDGTAQEETLNHPSESAVDSFKGELIGVDFSKSLEESYYNLEYTLKQCRIL